MGTPYKLVAMSQETETETSAENIVRQIQEPAHDPEFVGSHSGAVKERCQHPDSLEEMSFCGAKATHTQVYKDENGLHEIAACDDCGISSDVMTRDRSWSVSRGDS